jgi:WD40 repeat protein
MDARAQRVLLAERENGPLVLWERQSAGWRHRNIDGDTGILRQIAWSEDGRFAVTRSQDGILRVWDIDLGNLAWSIATPKNSLDRDEVEQVAFLGRDRIATAWRSGSFREDVCEVCRSAAELRQLAAERTRVPSNGVSPLNR